MSLLLVCGCLVSCFSVDAFAADDSGQLSLPLSGGQISIYWNSHWNGNGVSYGNFDASTAHVLTFTGWKGTDDNYSVTIRQPVLKSAKLDFSSTFHLAQGRDYYLSLGGLGCKFADNEVSGAVIYFLDTYNNLVWSYNLTSPGNSYSQNGFLYCVLRDCPLNVDVSRLQIVFNQSNTAYYPDKTFQDGSWNTWLQIIQLAKDDDRSADTIVKAIQDQTAADQSRYDDFTSNGSQQGPDAITGAQESVSGKIGLLDFAESVLSDFIGLFSDTPGDATLTLPGFKWHDTDTNMDLTVWEAQTFDFAFIEEHFKPLDSALRVGTVLAVYGAMLWYLQGVFDRIFRGGDENN